MSKLKPCPFCGSEAAEPVFIGNDHTKKRTVTIKCKAPGCTKGVTVGALRFSHEWCHEEAVKKWNTRATDNALAAAEARIAELESLVSDIKAWDIDMASQTRINTGKALMFSLPIKIRERIQALLNKEPTND